MSGSSVLRRMQSKGQKNHQEDTEKMNAKQNVTVHRISSPRVTSSMVKEAQNISRKTISCRIITVNCFMDDVKIACKLSACGGTLKIPLFH